MACVNRSSSSRLWRGETEWDYSRTESDPDNRLQIFQTTRFNQSQIKNDIFTNPGGRKASGYPLTAGSDISKRCLKTVGLNDENNKEKTKTVCQFKKQGWCWKLNFERFLQVQLQKSSNAMIKQALIRETWESNQTLPLLQRISSLE